MAPKRAPDVKVPIFRAPNQDPRFDPRDQLRIEHKGRPRYSSVGRDNNLEIGTLAPAATARVQPFDRAPPVQSRRTDSRVYCSQGHMSVAPSGHSRPRTQRAHSATTQSRLVQALVFAGGAGLDPVPAIPLSKRHNAPPQRPNPINGAYTTGAASPAPVVTPHASGRRTRSDSPCARSHLSLSELVPERNPARELKPHPARAHERPSSDLPRGLGHKARVPSADGRPVEHDGFGFRVDHGSPRGLARVPVPHREEAVVKRRMFDVDQLTDRQLEALKAPSRKRYGHLREGDPYILTQNELLPASERYRAADPSPARRPSPFRTGLANRCSSPNILGWS